MVYRKFFKIQITIRDGQEANFMMNWASSLDCELRFGWSHGLWYTHKPPGFLQLFVHFIRQVYQ